MPRQRRMLDAHGLDHDLLFRRTSPVTIDLAETDAERPDLRPRVGREKLPIAVVGGGFSGTMAAIQLARAVPPDQPILLCERGLSFGIGVAYATKVSEHLLNVRAANMSAFASEPGHFQSWLVKQGDAVGAEVHRTDAGVFATRDTYGKYLRSILYDAVCRNDNAGQLRLLPDDIVDCRRVDGAFELVSGSGRVYRAVAVVLATGHVPPMPSPDPRYVNNPWAPGALTGLDRERPVLVLGTALTMADVALALRREGFSGPMIALSRRGLLPERHEATETWPTPSLTDTEWQSVRLVMRRLRAEVAVARTKGIDWRAVIDSVRPITQELWRAWPDAERRRFIRHARRWWDVHRHRMAPPNAAMLDRMLRDGGLRIVSGRVGAMRFDVDAVRVTYEPHGGGAPIELAVQRVVVATGLESAAKSSDPLMRQLIERRLLRWDGLGFGIEVTPELQIVDADGHPVPRFWALGPLVRGMFWECIAVPDIRLQAERLGKLAAVTLAMSVTRDGVE